MDLADQSQTIEDWLLDERIAAARGATPQLGGSGACLHCAAPLPPPQRWCDADCRDDWQLLRASARGDA